MKPKTVTKKPIRAVLLLAVCLLLMPPTGALATASTGASAVTDEAAQQVVAAIDAYVAPYLGQNALTNYGGKASLCHAFVNYTWKNVFGYDLYQGVHSTTPAADDYSEEAICRYIHEYARPGDILRMDKNTHSMVITDFDDASVTGYDWLRSSANPPYISKRTYTWDQIAKWRNWSSVGGESYFLYQVNDNVYNQPLNKARAQAAAAEPAFTQAALAELTTVNRGALDRSSMLLQIDNPNIMTNGQTQPIDDQGSRPLIRDGRALLPLRPVVQNLGGTLDWNPTTKTITVTQGSVKKAELVVDQKKAVIDGQTVTLPVAPIIVKNRVLLPIRPIAEALGGTVLWNAADKTVIVIY